MHRTLVESSTICSIGYDQANQILEVEFEDGRVYQYYNVPLSVYEGLMGAVSHGGYLDKYVKKAGYHYQQIF